MIIIKKSSKLFKFYDYIADLLFFNMVTSRNKYQDNEIGTFSDVCTFLRTTALYVFFSIPLWGFLIFNFTSICVAIFNYLFGTPTSLQITTFKLVFSSLFVIVFIIFWVFVVNKIQQISKKYKDHKEILNYNKPSKEKEISFF